MYKNTLRRELLTARAEVKDARELALAASRFLLPMLRGNVMIYISIGSELCTRDIISLLSDRKDVTLFAPYTSDGNITPRRLVAPGKPDRYGNLAVDSYGETCFDIDMCVTPLVGFNGKGHRIGYGKGCYDRFFAAHDTYRIGLAYDCQRADFEAEPHDIPLDCCVTPSGVIYFDHAHNIW